MYASYCSYECSLTNLCMHKQSNLELYIFIYRTITIPLKCCLDILRCNKLMWNKNLEDIN